MLFFPVSLHSESFTNNSSLLSSDVYPNIHKYIKALNIKQSPNKDVAQKMADNVFYLIAKTLDMKDVVPLTPPIVFVTKMSSDIRDVYFLNTVIILFDSQQSIKNVCVTSMSFEKKFVLFVAEKGKIEV